MGSAAAAVAALVEISSDEEDGEEMPAAGKRKSPEDDFAWLDYMLAKDDDCGTIGAGWDDPAALQAFSDSLMCAAEIVMGDNDKNTPADACGGDDDDDCVILDGDPDKPVAVAKAEGPRRDPGDDELLIVAEKGELACRDFPHPRHLCATMPFSTSSHATHCSMCHCYVCDSPAPCAFWGKGTARTDHCHATDKDAKWKKLRQSSKNKNEPTPKRRTIQNPYHSIAAQAFSQSQHSANVNGSTGRFPVSSTVSQNQQVDPYIMAPRNMAGQRISLLRAPSPLQRPAIPSFGAKSASLPRAPSPLPRPAIPSYGAKSASLPRAPSPITRPAIPSIGAKSASLLRPPSPLTRPAIPSIGAKSARVVPPVYTPSNGNHSQPSVPNYGLMRPARPQALQTAQVPPGGLVSAGTFQNYHPQLRSSAPIGYQGQQYRPSSYPQIAPNTVVGSGVPLSPCTSSVTSQGTQYPHVPSTDTELKEALDFLARDLGVSDYSANQLIDQQSASTPQSHHPVQQVHK